MPLLALVRLIAIPVRMTVKAIVFIVNTRVGAAVKDTTSRIVITAIVKPMGALLATTRTSRAAVRVTPEKE